MAAHVPINLSFYKGNTATPVGTLSNIAIKSWNWGAANAGLNAQTGVPVYPTNSSLVITKAIDATSPILFNLCCNGSHTDVTTGETIGQMFDQVKLTHFRNSSGNEATSIILYNAFITSYSLSSVSPQNATGINLSTVEQSAQGYTPADSNPAIPAESISFNFSKIAISYPSTNTNTHQISNISTSIVSSSFSSNVKPNDTVSFNY